MNKTILAALIAMASVSAHADSALDRCQSKAADIAFDVWHASPQDEEIRKYGKDERTRALIAKLYEYDADGMEFAPLVQTAVDSCHTAPPKYTPGDAKTIASKYMEKVQRRVRPYIEWNGQSSGLETVINVHCAPTGTVLNATIQRSSGNDQWDAAALRAVNRSDPMPLSNDGNTPAKFSITLRPAGG
jgi:TolA protein